MKTHVFVLLGLLLLCSTLNAQYAVNKTKYDYRTYVYKLGDPYNPSVAGLTSFLIPGLGQMISGEGGRGVAFLAGEVGCIVIYYVGCVQAINALEDDIWGDEYQGEGLGLMVVGLLGTLAVDIWSIVDAVRVAKVNNLAWRDQNATGFNIQIQPYINTEHIESACNTQIGLTMKLNF